MPQAEISEQEWIEEPSPELRKIIDEALESKDKGLSPNEKSITPKHTL